EAFGHLVQGAVVGGDHVRGGGHEQAGGIHPAGVQPVDLLKQHFEVDDDAVSYHGGATGREDPGGKHVQFILLLADDAAVVAVLPAAELHHIVVARCELVGGSTFAFVAPLGAQHDYSWHVHSPSRV